MNDTELNLGFDSGKKLYFQRISIIQEEKNQREPRVREPTREDHEREKPGRKSQEEEDPREKNRPETLRGKFPWETPRVDYYHKETYIQCEPLVLNINI